MRAKGTITIETPRLILRKITLTDAPQMFSNWAADPDVTAYLTWQPHANIEVTKSIIANWISKYDSNLYFQWVIEVKTNKEVIGTISLFDIDESQKKGEIGYCMSKSYWGKGIMTEALQYVLNYLINETDFKIVTSRHDKDNPASGKVMLKNGFVFIDTKKEYSNKMNRMITICYYQKNLKR